MPFIHPRAGLMTVTRSLLAATLSLTYAGHVAAAAAIMVASSLYLMRPKKFESASQTLASMAFIANPLRRCYLSGNKLSAPVPCPARHALSGATGYPASCHQRLDARRAGGMFALSRLYWLPHPRQYALNRPRFRQAGWAVTFTTAASRPAVVLPDRRSLHAALPTCGEGSSFLFIHQVSAPNGEGLVPGSQAPEIEARHRRASMSTSASSVGLR